MKGSGWEVCVMETEPCISEMEHLTRVTGILVTLTDTVNLRTSKARHMKESGPTICDMDWVKCATSMASSTMVAGLRMDEKALGAKFCQINKHFTVTMRRVKRMASVSTSGKTVLLTREIGSTTR